MITCEGQKLWGGDSGVSSASTVLAKYIESVASKDLRKKGPYGGKPRYSSTRGNMRRKNLKTWRAQQQTGG